MSKRLLTALAVSLLVACAAEVPLIPQTEVDAARQAGTLASLYQRLGTELAREDISSKSRSRIETQRRDIGDLLAAERAQQIQGTLKAYPSLVPLSVLLDAEQQAEPVKQWSATRYTPLMAELSGKRQQTQEAIDARLLQLNALGIEDASTKIQVFNELIALNGGEAAAMFEQQKAEFVEYLYSTAVVAVERAQFEEAGRLLEPVAMVNPDYKGIRQLQLQVNASLFEKRFYDALGQGRPEEAYQLFLELAESPGFDLVRDQIAPTAAELAKYFALLGDKQRKQGNMQAAFNSFRYARYISNHLGKTATYSSEEKNFIAALDKQFATAQKSGDTVLAYGYLLALESLDPSHSSLKRHMRSVREAVQAEAEVKIAAMPLSNANKERAYGGGLASKVSQYLLSEIPDDVDIIERAQFDSILQKAKRPDASTYLSYYYVQGEILEASVDTSEKPNDRQVRVVTEYSEAPNPEHQKWLDLSSGARREQPEPPRMIKIPKKEDVTIRGTAVKKVGVFSVIFRLVDPFTSKVLFVDSLTEKSMEEGENVQGMEIGEFRQEAKSSDLPSDSEMLDVLADRVAGLIANRLIEEFKQPELRYREYGQRAMQEEKLQPAAINFGYAAILAEKKQAEDAASVREEFLDALMRSSR